MLGKYVQNNNLFDLFDFHFYFQAKKGYFTESETDTEVIAKLLKFLYDRDMKSDNKSKLTFQELVEQVIRQLVRFQPIIVKPGVFCRIK